VKWLYMELFPVPTGAVDSRRASIYGKYHSAVPRTSSDT
jgi:hypothetical protein